MVIYSVLILISLGFIYYFISYIRFKKMGLDVKPMIDNWRATSQKRAFFFNDIDLDDGNYSLYINHKTFGEFMVLDQEALKENKDSLKISLSIADFFISSEKANRNECTLFKNNIAVKSKSGSSFKNFEIGTLPNYSIPVKRHETTGNRATILAKVATLKEEKTIFYALPKLHFLNNKDYYFSLQSPSIVLPVTRTLDAWGGEKIESISGQKYLFWQNGQQEGAKKKWIEQIKQCIREKATPSTDFEIKVEMHLATHNYLLQTVGEHEYPITTKEEEYISVQGFHNFWFQLYFRANKEDAEKLYAMDFSDCIREDSSNKKQFKDTINDLLIKSGQDNFSSEEGGVQLYGHRNTFIKPDEISETQHTLRWYEISNQH